MDKVLTTTLLTMAALVAAVMVMNTIIPVLGTSGSSILSSSGAAADQIRTNFTILTAIPDSSTVHVWIKNVGDRTIEGISSADVFLQEENVSQDRYIYATGTPAASEWGYLIEGQESSWRPKGTIKVTLEAPSALSSNTDYSVTFVASNGVKDSKDFSQ